MAKDAELDRLKTAQDLTFQRKQSAYQAQDQVWKRQSSAREALNRAHEGKQSAYVAQEASWQDYPASSLAQRTAYRPTELTTGKCVSEHEACIRQCILGT